MNLAHDVDGLGNIAQAEDLRVEADRDVDVIFARKEKQRIAPGAEFAVLLHGVDFVDLLLDLRRGHGGIEDENIGAEVRSWSAVRAGLGGERAGSRNGNNERKRELTSEGSARMRRNTGIPEGWIHS